MTQPTPRGAGLGLLLAAFLAFPAAAETSFEFEPPAPLSTDTIQIRATYLSSCFLGLGRSEVLPGVLHILAFEGCACPPVLPSPVEVVTTVDTLPAGSYVVDLVVTSDPLDPECDFPPRPEGSGELAVAEAPGLLFIDPAVATTEDVVAVTVRSGCPFGVELPSRKGNLLRITTVPSQSLAPCVNMPVYQVHLPFGRLPAGDYGVVVLFADGSSAAVVTQTTSFRVHPAAADALVLQGGRFRVTATWSLANGRIGAGRALPLTADTGTFWFFTPANLELITKVLNGCDINGHYWVFSSGLTNVGVILEVEDTLGGGGKLYAHTVGSPYLPVLDTRAFPCP